MTTAKEVQASIDTTRYERDWNSVNDSLDAYQSLVVACMEAIEDGSKTAWVKWGYEITFKTSELKQAIRRKQWTVYGPTSQNAREIMDRVDKDRSIEDRGRKYSKTQVQSFFNSLGYDF